MKVIYGWYIVSIIIVFTDELQGKRIMNYAFAYDKLHKLCKRIKHALF